MTVLDATCAWVNPGLVLVATAIALLDLAVAAQRWAVMRSASPTPTPAPAPAWTVVVTAVAESASPVTPSAMPPGLRDMVGRD